ncbi:MAG: glycosyltransferase [Cytophagales bacterium]
MALHELSILIPVYNFGVEKLVADLHSQLQKLMIAFEIRLYDDASTENFKALNKAVEKYKGIIYRELPQNLGRSKIRNLLAKDAEYENLLFLDCDNEIIAGDYIQNYLDFGNELKVLVGGNAYYSQKPVEPKYRLHWLVGKKREEKRANVRNQNPFASFTLNNMLIKKSIYLAILLDESIKTYGHEDTKFGYGLQTKNIKVLHIDNPTYHIGLSENKDFLFKTKQAVNVLFEMVNKEGIGNQTGLYSTYSLLNKYKLAPICLFILNFLDRPIVKNLLSATPNLLLFDLYKLMILLRLERENTNLS